jgi:hypothetical protein
MQSLSARTSPPFPKQTAFPDEGPGPSPSSNALIHAVRRRAFFVRSGCRTVPAELCDAAWRVYPSDGGPSRGYIVSRFIDDSADGP